MQCRVSLSPEKSSRYFDSMSVWSESKDRGINPRSAATPRRQYEMKNRVRKLRASKIKKRRPPQGSRDDSFESWIKQVDAITEKDTKNTNQKRRQNTKRKRK